MALSTAGTCAVIQGGHNDVESKTDIPTYEKNYQFLATGLSSTASSASTGRGLSKLHDPQGSAIRD